MLKRATAKVKGAVDPFDALNATIQDTSTLHLLLETVDELIRELDYGTGDERRTDWDRAAAVISVAGDLAERISKETSANYNALLSALEARRAAA